MWEDLIIDERGRFQMPSEDLAAFIRFLKENGVKSAAEGPAAFTTEGQSYGYGRLQNRYDAGLALSLHRYWKQDHDASRPDRSVSRN